MRIMILATLAAWTSVLPTVVLADPADVTGSGTGFFVNAEGWLVTNAHVVEGCARASVLGLGDLADMKVDKQNDLAAARVVGTAPKATLRLRQRPPRLGEDVAAFGYPLRGMLSESVKVTTGNINSLTGLRDDTRFLQVSTPIQPGNSGGPLVDREGSLLGITTSTLALDAMVQAGALAQNVNFAIRSTVLEIFLQSRGISYGGAGAPGEKLDTADLADKVAPAVVQVFCHGAAPAVTAAATPPPAVAPEPVSIPPAPAPSPSIADAAKEFLRGYNAAWSQPNSSALAYMGQVYSGSLDFYGRQTPASVVMKEKRDFAVRWPRRYYRIEEDTLAASCVGQICTATGVVDWFAKSDARGKHASGKANFEVRVDVSRGVILAETGGVLKGAKPQVEPLLYAWHQLNGDCRGGSGDDPATMRACDARNLADAALAAADWCYGRQGEYGAQMEWHRCARDSLR